VGAVKIVILCVSLLEKLVDVIAAAIAGTGDKTPEEVRDSLKKIIDSHDDAWLEAEIQKADETFNKPGGTP